MSPLPLYKGTSTLLLHSSGIFSLHRSLLKKFTKNSTPLFSRDYDLCFHWYIIRSLSFSLLQFPQPSPEFFSRDIFHVPFSLSSALISLLSLGFSWLSKLLKYSFHLCFTFSFSISISPVLLLITLTFCNPCFVYFSAFLSEATHFLPSLFPIFGTVPRMPCFVPLPLS